MTETSAETALASEARRLIDRPASSGIVLRLLGGLAIQMLTPELPPRTRSGQDLDFGSIRSSRKALTEMLAEEGYVGDRNFNALYGDKQLYFTHADSGLAIDVMIDRLHMCHTVEFAERVDGHALHAVAHRPAALQAADRRAQRQGPRRHPAPARELRGSTTPTTRRHRPARDPRARRRRLGLVEDDLAQSGADPGCAGRRLGGACPRAAAWTPRRRCRPCPRPSNRRPRAGAGSCATASASASAGTSSPRRPPPLKNAARAARRDGAVACRFPPRGGLEPG